MIINRHCRSVGAERAERTLPTRCASVPRGRRSSPIRPIARPSFRPRPATARPRALRGRTRMLSTSWPSLGSITSATPVGGLWVRVRPCVVPCLAGGPSPDTQVPSSFALQYTRRGGCIESLDKARLNQVVPCHCLPRSARGPLGSTPGPTATFQDATI